MRLWPTDSDATVVDDEGFTESVAFSPDGEVFAAHGSNSTTFREWSMPGGMELTRGGGVQVSGGFPTGPLAFSPDGSILATLFGVRNTKGDRYDSVVILWTPYVGEVGRLRPAKNTSHHATRLAFSPDGRLLAGIYGPDLIVWDVAARREVVRYKPSKKHFKGVAFTADGSRLLTVSNDAVIQVWAAPNWQPLTTYTWKIGKLGCVAVSADGTLAAAGGNSGKVVVLDLD